MATINTDTVAKLKTLIAGYTTDTARNAQNAAGGITLWSIPDPVDRRHFAFHPFIFIGKRFLFETADYPIPSGAKTYNGGTSTVFQAIDRVDEILLPIHDEDGNLVTTLTADTMDGEASFDAGTIVRTWFSSTMQDNDYENYGEPDRMLSVQMKVYLDDDAPTTATTYIVQNAVSQSGSDGDKEFEGNIFGQDNKHIVVWSADDDATPTVTVLLKNNVNIDGTLYEGGHTYQFEIGSRTVLEHLDTFLGLIEAGFTIEDDDYIERCGGNALRWLNRKGAIEYYVFRQGMSKTKTASTKAVREVYGTNYKDMRGNRLAIDVEGKRSVTLRATGLTYDELDLLTKMPYSPRIQWFDHDNDMWVDVTVEQFSNEEVTKLRHTRASGELVSTDNLYTFEVTLACPAINMQFQ